MVTRHWLSQPISALPGIGTKSSANFEKLGLFLIQDLLFHVPIRYEDRTSIQKLADLVPGKTANVYGEIVFADIVPRGKRSMICRLEDGTGCLDLRFFHYTAKQFQTLKSGVTLNCYGEVRYGYAGLEMVHPDYKVITKPIRVLRDASLTPVYPLTQGLTQGMIRKSVQHILDEIRRYPDNLIDWLPELTVDCEDFPSLHEAINQLHAPKPNARIDELAEMARRRIAYEELLTHHISLKQAKQLAGQWHAPRFEFDAVFLEQFKAALPFPLTNAQQRVIQEIVQDCKQTYPMLRLIQGDVGSGKTVVAACAALIAIRSGYQVAMMAPTELLAEQHYQSFSSWFDPLDIPITLLTAQTRGSARKEIITQIAEDSVKVVIGTHALFQDAIIFANLGLLIIDEQHRFGVHQRLSLREKGEKGQIRPHQLVLTATPIPRTLAMLQYSDLDISIIDELPPGRKPIATSVINSSRRDAIIDRIKAWVKQKKQAYWVCTLIEESDFLQCEAVEKTAQQLTETLSGIRIGLLHGRLKAAEKETIMLAFKTGDIDLLVATTVIEVGIDVPNASLMIIDNAERLGLSQLHQLRGRVGRGSDDSFCLLLYQAPLSETARQRLSVLRDSQDGFLIAEKDLQLRGPGEVMGTRQTGQVQFKIADLSRDAALLDAIPDRADFVLKNQPDAVAPLIERWLRQNSDYSEV